MQDKIWKMNDGWKTAHPLDLITYLQLNGFVLNNSSSKLMDSSMWHIS